MSKLDLFFHLFGFYKEHWRAWHLGLIFFFFSSTLLVLDHFIVSANNEKERWKEQLWTAGLLTRCWTGIQVSSFDGGLDSLKTKQNLKNSEFTLFVPLTHDVTQICRPERSLKKQNKQEKLLQGFLLSGCIPAESSKELCRASLGRSCQFNFRDSFLIT